MVDEQRVLPADVYDTLEFTSLVYGGIGAGYLSDKAKLFGGVSLITDTPYCILGHAGFASGQDEKAVFEFWQNPIANALKAAFGGDDPAEVNNRIVGRINARKRKDPDTRVSWKEYTRELNIVRGDS